MSGQEATAYAFRPYIKADINFIKSSWSKSYYRGASFDKILDVDEFNVLHRPIMARILNRPNATTIIACSKEDPNIIIGWILVEKTKEINPVIHYVYVKEVIQSEGLAKALVKSAIPKNENKIFYTHRTEKASRIIRNHSYNFEFNPEFIAEEMT